MQVHGGLPIVGGVYVNGHGPYRFLVDTGTNVNLIDANLARSINLPANLRTKISSSTGVIEVTGGDGIELALDAAKAGDQEFLFLRPEAIHSKSGKDLPVGRPRRVFARERVAELRKQGYSYRQIARQLRIGEGTVRRVLK